MHIYLSFLSGINRCRSNLVLHCSSDRKPGGLAFLLSTVTGYKYYATDRICLRHTNKCCNSGFHDYPSINSMPINSRGGGEKDENLVKKTEMSFKAFRLVGGNSYILLLLIFVFLLQTRLLPCKSNYNLSIIHSTIVISH